MPLNTGTTDMLSSTPSPPLFLASASNRRADLLRQIGVAFAQRPTNTDESIHANEPAAAYVQRIALAKAGAGIQALTEPNAVVLAADTAVVVGGQVLGKPADRTDFLRMMDLLSGQQHQVMTAVALASTEGRWRHQLVTTAVQFRALCAGEAARYWDTGEPRGKAGGYAIQGLGGTLIANIEGSHSAVVGLPLCETAQLLHGFGIACWQQALSAT